MRRLGLAVSVALVLTGALTIACGSEEPTSKDGSGGSGGGSGGSGGTGGGSTGNGPTIDRLEASVNPVNTLSYFVSWRTDEAASTELHVRCGDDYDALILDAGPRTNHEVFVMGLYGGAECTLTARATGWGGALSTRSISLTVGQPPDILPELTVTMLDEQAIEPGWTLFNLSKRFDDEPPLVAAMVDEHGRYRWYHERATQDTGEDTDVRVVPEGVLIGGTRFVNAAIVDWEGSLVWEAPFPMHHHISPYGRPGQYLYLVDSGVGCTDYGAGVVTHFDRITGDTLWVWRLCQHWTPPVPEKDWSHTNTIEPIAGEEAFLLSSRNQNQLYKVNMVTENVEWALGEGGDFQMADADIFLHQHAPEWQPNGNVLIYDNGLKDRREWSRAIELELDMTNMTATSVWEFRPEPDIFTEIWGDADRLGNGNTLVTFGRREIDLDSHIIEVSPDGTEVWHLVTPIKWGWYRAERTQPRFGHVIVGG